MKEVLVRASIGSGFHAPSVPQVKADLRPYGVTSDKYTCSADLAVGSRVIMYQSVAGRCFERAS